MFFEQRLLSTECSLSVDADTQATNTEITSKFHDIYIGCSKVLKKCIKLRTFESKRDKLYNYVHLQLLLISTLNITLIMLNTINQILN